MNEKLVFWQIFLTMKNVNTYVNFNGTCEDAFAFYKGVFKKEYFSFFRFSDMPAMDGVTLAEKDREKIMHVSLPLTPHFTLMGSDVIEGIGAALTEGNNFSISLNVNSSEEANYYHQALSLEGKITMPLGETFWGSYFGMVCDKYGINWMISFEENN